jgi:uncharacterized protein YceK
MTSKLLTVVVTILAGVQLSACATIIEGTSQEILVSSNPAGASCVLEREGQPIATLASTPSTALIKKSKHDITIKCKKDGFEEATYINNSGLASGSVAGNVAADLILTAGLSSIIDSASGADNQYESPVNITLIPKSAAPLSTAPLAPPPAPIVAPADKPKKPGSK